MSWTEENVSELRRLWDAGYTASQIGRRIGLSKNAVIGKAHRLGLKARPSPIRRNAVKPIPQPAPPKMMHVETPPSRPLPTVMKRRSTGGPSCLWPIGDPGDPDFHFCDAPAAPGKPYCVAHCSRAYISRSRGETEAA